MSQADRIRAFVVQRFVQPARMAGRSSLTVRAGDVHQAMGLANMPRAVCSVLRGSKLHQDAGVIFKGQEGPADGMNVWFHFDLTGGPIETPAARRIPTSSVKPSSPIRDVSDWSGALALISCTKAKLSKSAPARDIYSSPAFQMKRQLAERAGASWVVLSAKHGILQPDDVVEPYDETLTTMGVAARKAWARNVLPTLIPLAREAGHVVCLAGQRYIEFLVQPMTEAGVSVLQPLKGLRQGEQLAWLTQHQ